MDSVCVYDPIDYMWVAHADDWLWHLKRIQADYAWDFTLGDPDIKTAVIDYDFDITHPDLSSKISPPYDPFTNYQYSCNTNHWHGTTVASFAAAETTEQGGSPQGQLASVGFNTKIIGYLSTSSRQTNLKKALHASNVMGANVIVSCAGASLKCSPDPDSGEELIVKEILDNGTVIVMPAGNGLGGYHCGTPPNNYYAFYPFNPVYDERIIVVTSTDFNDYHQFYYQNEATHSHFPAVDICAPGYDIMGASQTDCGSNQWPYYGSYGGTSFSSPIVAGVCALLKSIDPEFSPAEIQYFIKSTADPVSDANNYPGMLGAGRINAFKAVEKAYYCNPVIVNSDETWSDNRIIVCGIEVTNNAKLTITGEVKLSKRSAIIIERGAELILDGGKLTNLDFRTWQGIQVWGTATAPQSTPGAQGKLTVINGGTIENAIAAVRMAKTDGIRYEYGYEGGIIQTDDAHFINNRIGVRFYPYRYQVSGVEVDNLSYFYNSEFLTDAELADQSLPEKFIHFDNIKGINVKGCSFINSRPEEETEMNERGVGIYSEDANFTVTDYCLDPPGCEDLIPSVFQLLNYGIEAYKEETTKSFDVNNSNFYNNLTGIYIKGVDNPEIIFNNFELKSVSLFHQPGDIFGGLYLDGSPRFTVEENYFYNEDPFDPQSEISSIGITVSNCGDLQNIIYRNTFDRLHLAILAQGRNRGTNYTTGLKLHCNVCTNNMNDFAVTADGSALNQGISERQGAYNPSDMTAPAGNLFSHEYSTDPYRDFNNTLSGSRVTYYQHTGSNGDPWELTYYQNITKNEYGYFPGYEDACPAHFYSGGHKKSAAIVLDEDNLKDLLILREYQRDSLINILNLWVDAGDTPQLDYTVESSTPDEALEVYDELISYSPYISDTVLASSIEKQDVLVNAMVRDIMVANPHGAKKEELAESLEARIPPLPDYMMAEIMNGRDTLSLKELKEGEITWYEQERNSAFASLLNLYLAQTTESSGDSLVSLISNHGYLKDHYLLAARFLEKGDITNAFSVLDELSTKFSMTSGELSEYQDYLTLFSILGDLKLAGQPLDSMNASSRQTLYQIAEDNFTPGMLAQNILQRIDTVEYHEIYILPTSEPTENKYYGENPDFNANAEDGVFRVYPNPCLDYFIIEYFFTVVPQNAAYSIVDPLGRTIEEGKIAGHQNQVIRRATAFSPGVLTIQLIIDGKVEKEAKLTIIK